MTERTQRRNAATSDVIMQSAAGGMPMHPEPPSGQAGGMVTCNFAPFANGTNAQFSLTIKIGGSGSVSNTALFNSSDTSDPNAPR